MYVCWSTASVLNRFLGVDAVCVWYMCVCVCALASVRACVCVQARACVCVCVCMCVFGSTTRVLNRFLGDDACVYSSMCICVCVFVRINIKNLGPLNCQVSFEKEPMFVDFFIKEN